MVKYLCLFIGGIKMNDNDFVRRIINIYGNRDKEVIKEKLLEASEIHSKLTKVDSSLIKSMLLESYMAFHDLKINDRFSYMVGYLWALYEELTVGKIEADLVTELRRRIAKFEANCGNLFEEIDLGMAAFGITVSTHKYIWVEARHNKLANKNRTIF